MIADFNLDGKLDLLTVCDVEDNLELAIYLGNGDGTFQETPVYSELTGYLVSFNIGDFNGDGIPDVVIINEPDSVLPQLTVMFGVGDGTFTTGPTVGLPTLVVESPVPGDYNGDGILDLAVVDIYDDVVSVLAGNGDGTFQAPQSFGVVGSPSYMLSGQFQAGGKPGDNDLIVCTPSGIEVLLNRTR